MKNSIFILAITALLFTGCDNKKSNEHSHDSEGTHEHTDNSHEHEDGSVHQDHQDAEHIQEEFNVESDSTSVKKEEQSQSHSHKEGDHQH
ncbi:MAG: hypothetical protein M3Q58_15100 [Bacteroidota bacterium]|nr:hypothetical protein [Bacteroidota bacterium]